MAVDFSVTQYVEEWSTSLFAHCEMAPWHIIQTAEDLISKAIARLEPDYLIDNEFAIHPSATIESGVILKGPGIVGPRCFVASGSYLRGGVFLSENCIVGPGSELKTSFMFSSSKIAHLNFVGDSVIGSGVNIEAGAIIANYRNELDDHTIRILFQGESINTGVSKFGSLIGDKARIGANAVVAPGALIAPGGKVGRLQLLDQYPY